MSGESVRARTSDSTAAKARDIRARHAAHCQRMTSTDSVELIAREENVRSSTVWGWLKLSRGPTEVDAPPDQSNPAEKRRPGMTQRTLAHKVWQATRFVDVFRLLGAGVTLFWMNTIMQIHELGEDCMLGFGAPGDAYRSRKELAEAGGLTEAELDDLIWRGLLIETEGGALAMPYRFGLRPRERFGQGPSRPPKPDRRQGTLGPMGLPSRPDSNRSPIGVQPESEAKIGPDSDRSPAVLTAGVRLAGGESTTTTTTKKEESLLLGGGLVTACEAGAPPDSDRTPVVDSNLTPAAPPLPHVTLAAELAAITGRPGQPTPTDLNAVKTCLDSGATPDGFRKFVEGRMTREKLRADPPTLSWLAKGYLDVVRNPRPATPIAPTPVSAPEPPEDPAATVALIHPEERDNDRLVECWPDHRGHLRTIVPEAEYRTWIRGMKLGGLDGDEIVMLFDRSFQSDWVAGHYGPQLTAWWKGVYPEAHRVVCRAP